MAGPYPPDATNGDIYTPAVSVTTQEEADEHLEKIVRHLMRNGRGQKDALSIAKQNLGYWSGYFDEETMARTQRLYKTTHPVFGVVGG